MFGYVRPFRGELKCKDYDLYRETYCGLCCTLRERYGFFAPLFLSYDFTFLALLLDKSEYHPCKGRCHGKIFCPVPRVPPSDALNRCADLTMILTWFQLQDKIKDDKGIAKLGARFLSLLVRRSYKKAEKYHPDFCQNTATQLSLLATLESQQCASLDQVADCFALVLQDTMPKDLSSTETRCLKQVLYHVGRWIYLIDARDDYEDDVKKGRYNPLVHRYSGEIDQEALCVTLNHSRYLALSALDFLDLPLRGQLLENILDVGMSAVQDSVLQDRWKTEKNHKMWRKSRERSL